MMKFWDKLANAMFPECPSGLGHIVRRNVVTNVLGSKYCWHPDCMAANFKEVKNYQDQKFVDEVYSKVIDRLEKDGII